MRAPARVAFATVGEHGLVLGHPSHRHAELTICGLVERKVGLVGADDDPQPEMTSVWSIAWEDVQGMRVVAVKSRRSEVRHGSPLRSWLAALVSHQGGEPVDAQVTVITGDGEHSIDCAGFIDGRYSRGDVAAIAGLLDIAVQSPAVQASFADPERVLTALQEVAQTEARVPEARRSLAQLLVGSGTLH